MAIKTQRVPRQTKEVFDDTDREEIHRIIADLRDTYVERHTEALREYHEAQRQVNRLSHEVSRLERHLTRIDNFCINNDIPLGK